ncbi:d0e56a9e-8f06-4ed1-80ce-09b9716eff26 [Thermothielavioides terrestris]|uniref:D0e56a9e-8f06-4ed1-80ce-09b9716eff26 n=1 Tax=Thermothielavioides terrestris TaxID=2587410 RepID=A0A3S4F811_9PEZI|nr:d0e56a9e-8f06-4ed1-80ce-09b9716eff26 [Thermothielavioides terrestris]
MKLAAALSLVSLAAAAVMEPRHCAGNNCNRAVTGTRPGLLPLASRSLDCSSFLRTTVTPAATTITVTVDGEDLPTPTAHAAAVLAGRQVTVVPSSIPEYAANCANAAEYISACSCFGVTGTVTTAPRPTVTVTTTVDSCEDI